MNWMDASRTPRSARGRRAVGLAASALLLAALAGCHAADTTAGPPPPAAGSGSSAVATAAPGSVPGDTTAGSSVPDAGGSTVPAGSSPSSDPAPPGGETTTTLPPTTTTTVLGPVVTMRLPNGSIITGHGPAPTTTVPGAPRPTTTIDNSPDPLAPFAQAYVAAYKAECTQIWAISVNGVLTDPDYGGTYVVGDCTSTAEDFMGQKLASAGAAQVAGRHDADEAVGQLTQGGRLCGAPTRCWTAPAG